MTHKSKHSTAQAVPFDRVFLVVNTACGEILGTTVQVDEAYGIAEGFVRWGMSLEGRLSGFGTIRDGVGLDLIAKFEGDLAALPHLTGIEFMRWWRRWQIQNGAASGTRVEVRELTIGVVAEKLDCRGVTEAHVWRTIGS